MSELMTPIPFRELMTWITTEYRRDGAVFGVHKPYKAGVKKLPIFGETIETPFGPAAGPNTQLAQNIIAGYFAGARFFELKTVQKMDGADLAACINRPCILAEDECYNCEWSTELYVQQAFEEYVKAWCALKIMAKVYGLGDPNGFVFNMSVGYDLAGIQGEKIDTFLNGMVDASKTPIFQECIAVLKEFFPGESDYIDTITPHVSGSVTVSTLHGCPPDEIERIASYLLEKKHLHTFVKCNPTILGYETARSILDSMGYDYIAFDDHHFKEDLQYSDAVPMFHRLQALADRAGSGIWPEALQHLPCGREGRGTAQRGDVHGGQVPLPPDHHHGRHDGQGVWREAAPLLCRRCRRLQHRQAVRVRYLAHHHGHHRAQARRLPAVHPDRRQAGRSGLQALHRRGRGRHRGPALWRPGPTSTM